MTQDIPKLKQLLGDKFAVITSLDDSKDSSLTNSKEIFCECKTLVIRSNHARLVVPNETMLELEKSLVHLNSDKFSKDLVRGCYWLVDDMYKFEQISYTKEIDLAQLGRLQCLTSKQEKLAEQQQSTTNAFAVDSPTTPATNDSTTQETITKSRPIPNSLRYLACAECNLCPLGWFDSKTKESYLYVW